MHARGLFIRQVLQRVVLLKLLRVSCVPLPVDDSRLKADDTYVFKSNLFAVPPPSCSLVSCPFEQAPIQ